MRLGPLTPDAEVLPALKSCSLVLLCERCFFFFFFFSFLHFFLKFFQFSSNVFSYFSILGLLKHIKHTLGGPGRSFLLGIRLVVSPRFSLAQSHSFLGLGVEAKIGASEASPW